MYTLTPTKEVQRFLEFISTGLSPTAAAKQSGLNPHESVLVRKLAGIPISKKYTQVYEDVLKLRSKGLTHRQIAQQLGISPSLVNKCICTYNKQSR